MQYRAMPRFAANLSTLFGEVEMGERFGRAAAAGFRGVEILFPYDHDLDQLHRALRSVKLECVLINLPPGDFAAGERGIAALPGRQAEFRTSVDTAISYARALSVPRLHVMAGLTQHGARRDVYVQNLRYAAEAMASEGRELLIEPINNRDMPGYLLSRQADALDVLAEVGAPNLRLQCDLYHLQIMGGDLSHVLTRDIAAIGHIQIAGVPDRAEPDAGEINYRHIFALLDALGYSGWVGCEYRPRGRTDDGLGWMRR